MFPSPLHIKQIGSDLDLVNDPCVSLASTTRRYAGITNVMHIRMWQNKTGPHAVS